jgi:hypothetical protein
MFLNSTKILPKNQTSVPPRPTGTPPYKGGDTLRSGFNLKNDRSLSPPFRRGAEALRGGVVLTLIKLNLYVIMISYVKRLLHLR